MLQSQKLVKIDKCLANNRERTQTANIRNGYFYKLYKHWKYNKKVLRTSYQ